MTSSYSSDPRVPPVHVEHLGKRRRPSPQAAEELPPVRPSADQGPSYEDFLELESEPGTDELPTQAG
ncbi:hypothetical protein VH571_00900 [Frondihabitans sp. 4ASC-45]|uniref:hypothetical protein n=1 Tax=Frondihabitans sp. 4ASC-45 TaxID=3111636 RepID=UPI003C1C8B62